jgi:hypothetical protein
MAMTIEHIDKISRDKKRDVIFINFNKEVYPSYEYQEYEERNNLIKWLNENNINYSLCGPMASENGWESYRGQLYIDVVIDDNDEQYKLICEHMDGPNGTFKIKGVESWIFPLTVALKNNHHDEPGFWDEWAENF